MFAPNGIEILFLILIAAALVTGGILIYQRLKAQKFSHPTGKKSDEKNGL